MKKYVCGCLDKGEAIGHGEIWCNEISLKDGSYHKRLGCIQTFPYTVFRLQEETHQMFRDLQIAKLQMLVQITEQQIDYLCAKFTKREGLGFFLFAWSLRRKSN